MSTSFLAIPVSLTHLIRTCVEVNALASFSTGMTRVTGWLMSIILAIFWSSLQSPRTKGTKKRHINDLIMVPTLRTLRILLGNSPLHYRCRRSKLPAPETSCTTNPSPSHIIHLYVLAYHHQSIRRALTVSHLFFKGRGRKAHIFPREPRLKRIVHVDDI